MTDNEIYSDFIKAAKAAFAEIAEDFEKAKEAFCASVEYIDEQFKELLEDLKEIDFDREPLPQPQKYILMKCFVIDRRKGINRIKKKKGTVYPCFFCDIIILLKQNVCKVSQNVVL